MAPLWISLNIYAYTDFNFGPISTRNGDIQTFKIGLNAMCDKIENYIQCNFLDHNNWVAKVQ